MIDYLCSRELPQLRRLWTDAFGEPEFWDCFLEGVFRVDHCRRVLINGELAAALYWFDCALGEKKLAYLYAVATDEKYRHRGLCRRLLQNTHDLLRQQGYAAAVLVPAKDELRVMYRKMGYADCGSVRSFTCCAGGEETQLRPIDADTYGALRRELLPQNSVLQEGDSLTHLASMAQLWAGEGMLLSAHREGEKLLVQEYLGDAAAAPGIVKTLGCTEGKFRMPGGSEAFAMVYPLGETVVDFSYFGLCF